MSRRLNRRSGALLVGVVLLVVVQLPFTMRSAEAFVTAPVVAPIAAPVLAPVAAGAAAVVVGGVILWGLWEGAQWAWGEVMEWQNQNDCESNGGQWVASIYEQTNPDWFELGGGAEARCVDPSEVDAPGGYVLTHNGNDMDWSSSNGESGGVEAPSARLADVTLTGYKEMFGTYDHVRLEVRCEATNDDNYFDNRQLGNNSNTAVTRGPWTVDCDGEAGATYDGYVQHARVLTCGITCSTIHAESRFAWVEGGVQPDRQVRTRIECTNGAGETYEVEELSPLYAPGDEPPIIPGASCLDDDRITGMDVDRIDGGQGSNVPTEHLTDWELPQSHLDPNHEFAECMVTQCEVHVYLQYPDGSRARCMDHGDLCRGWASNPAREDLYECWWGPYELALGQCMALRDAYETVNPTTITVPVPQPQLPPIESPHPNEDPTTEPNPAPVEPDPDAGVTEGVLQRVLERTLIPQHLDQAVAGLQADLAGKPPGSIVPTVGPVLSGLQAGWSSSSCGLLPTFMPDVLTQGGATVEDGRLPCEPPGSGWTAIYALVSVAIVAGTAWRLFAIAGAAMGGRSTGDAESDGA